MEKLRSLWQKYREVLTYLIFGGLTTLVNVGLFMALTGWTSLPTGAANALALGASILFAYVTNRRWVFESRQTGLAAWREFGMFVACRLATGVLDEVIVVAGVDGLGPMIAGAAGSRVWALGVKIFANVVVVIVNYVFSKWIIFRKQR